MHWHDHPIAGHAFILAALVSTGTMVLSDPLAVAQEHGPPPTFEHDAKPLLQEKCGHCHGESDTEAELSLATLRDVMAGGESGPVVVPGKPSASLLYEVVEAGDMPPDEDPLTHSELKLIRDWIELGQFPASGDLQPSVKTLSEEDKNFWSFVPPSRPLVPDSADLDVARTPIDQFISRKLEDQGRTLNPQADRRTLIKRLYFDMLGLPPKPGEVQAFVDSNDPQAYEKLIEQVLDSPHYGERWGRHWLDAAGWAESSLLTGDAMRPDFWRYRDYVIDSFNKDKPYDQFVLEQLAGDELVDWRDAEILTPEIVEKLVATGFLRCAPDATDNQLITQLDKYFDTQQVSVETSMKALMGLTMTCVRCHDHKYDPIRQQEYYSLVSFFQPAYDPENWIPGNVNKLGAGPVRAVPILNRDEREQWQEHCRDVYEEQAELLYQIDYGIENRFRDRLIKERLDQFEPVRRKAIREALERFERQRSEKERALVFNAAKELEITSALLKKTYPEMANRYKAARNRMNKQRKEFNDSLPDLIWALWDVSGQPSPTQFLTRGDYTKGAHAVASGVIEVLDCHLESSFDEVAKQTPQPSEDTTGRRLTLARWLTQPDHPLTARVMVNRIWQYHFGTGIVSTPDDFGQRGARPSHPELLDWLAVEFVENDWSIKHIHRLILKSATFRQASGSVGDRSLLSGFPRRRLESEIIRDRMLAVSGLIDLTRGGESVPSIEHSPGTYIIDPEHAGRYRRSVYISTQRSSQPAMLKTFDGPVMETNWPQRTSTTVAPQALTLMNHPFVREAAAALAERIENCPGDEKADRLGFAFRLVYGRAPCLDERHALESAIAGGTKWDIIAHALLSSNEFLYVD